MGASGRTGLAGRVADWWDSVPVEGPAMAAAVGVLGAALAFSGPAPLARGDCARTPLRHVYHPQRLTVIERCASATGTVIAWRHEHDGDYHVAMRMDDGGWTNAANARGQHGYTVVEFVPGDPRPTFHAGQRLTVRVTKVYDEQHKRTTEAHGWIEGHPVFAYSEVLDPPAAAPNNPGLAPATEDEHVR